jgi:protein-disulfide isomerase
MRRYLPFAIIGAVLLIGSAAALLLFRSQYSNTPLKIVAGNPGAEPSHVRGSPKARVTLEEFGDFQCPPCGLLAATLLKVEHDYGANMRVVFREFPLKMHAHAFTAACAAEAAGLQGHFWEMHDLLFKNSMQWGKEGPHPHMRAGPNAPPDEAATAVREIFTGYAESLGLDVERFKKDLDAEEVKVRIKSDQERALSIGVDRTPVLFIDGTQIPFSSFNVDTLHAVIDAELNGRPVESSFKSPTPGEPK